MEKTWKYLFIVVSFIAIASLFGNCIQAIRLDSAVAECRQYREQLSAASDRASDVRESLSRTSSILNETGTEITNLRKKLEALEDNYYYIYNLYCNDTTTLEVE